MEIVHARMRKKGTLFKEEFKDKKTIINHKVIKLMPNVETEFEVKFIPKKLK